MNIIIVPPTIKCYTILILWYVVLLVPIYVFTEWCQKKHQNSSTLSLVIYRIIMYSVYHLYSIPMFIIPGEFLIQIFL